jgi:hypothetical protein
MVNKGNLLEFVKGISGEDPVFGIANVHPDRAVKKCRIRHLRVEYFLGKTAVFLVTPKCCGDCERMVDCSDDFVLQIIEKYNDNTKNSDAYYIL